MPARSRRRKTGSFCWPCSPGSPRRGSLGMLIEFLVIRALRRDHLDQVLATFGLILFFNQLTVLLFGRQPLFVAMPPFLEGSVR
jgi:branched-chain amino acid transport system permease protein